MEPSIACAKAGVTTGEWGATLRGVFGEYRAPTGIGARRGQRPATAVSTRCAPRSSACRRRLGRRIKLLVGKPGLDGHSNGAEQIAVRARDCGMEVVYEGIRLTPAQIVRAAVDEAVHVVGLSILSGSHVPLVAEVMQRMRKEGLDDVPVVVGGIIPPEDAADAQGPRRRRRLHAEEFPAQRHHARYRRPGGRPRRGGVTSPSRQRGKRGRVGEHLPVRAREEVGDGADGGRVLQQGRVALAAHRDGRQARMAAAHLREASSRSGCRSSRRG